MVGVLVDHDLIASPVPARDDVVIVCGDVPEKIAEPEAFPVSSRKHEYMLRSKATGEAPVCPRLIDVIMRIVGATIMSDPLIVLGMNVRNFRMTCLVHGNAVLGRGSGLLTPCRGGSARRLGSLRGGRNASGNGSTPPKGFQDELARSLSLADEVVVAAIFKSEAIPEHERLDAAAVIAKLRASGKPVRLLDTADAIVDAIAPELRTGDVVAILSNGGFAGIYEKLPARLRALHEVSTPA